MESSFWEKVIIDSHTEFHLLRHFENPSTEYFQKLINNGFSKAKIEMENKIPGSKFFSIFASDALGLLSQVRNSKYEKKIEIDDTIYLIYEFKKSVFTKGIGTNAIIELDRLSAEQKSQVYITNVREYPLQYLGVVNLPDCWELTIVLRGNNSKLRLISAFPGYPGLPLPMKGMGEEKKQECLKFWSEHVILTESDK